MHTMHSSWTYQCPPLHPIHLFNFAHCKVSILWYIIGPEIVRNFMVATLIAEVIFKQLLICTAVQQVEHSRQ